MVGAGPGDPGLLTREGERWLSQAECVVYDRLANPALLDLAPDSAERIYVGKQPDRHTLSQEKINALLVEKTRAGLLVVRLKGGDPLIFGRGGEEADELIAAGQEFRIVPGVTASIAAGAYAGISLTDRRCATSLALVTGHEDPDKGDSTVDYKALAGIGTVVFYMGVGRLAAICAALIEAGKATTTPAALVENATRPGQRTVPGTLATLPELAKTHNVKPPALLVVGDVAALGAERNWFESLPLHGKTILVTRTRRQGSRLARELQSRGARIIEAPTIAIEPPNRWTMVDSALAQMESFDWVVFTSPNGVESTWGRLDHLGLDARVFAGSQIAAVGPGTAAALQTHGLKPDLLPETFTAAGLAVALTHEKIENAHMLLLRGDLAQPQLHDALKQAGACVRDVVAYRTVRPEALRQDALDALTAGEVDWITFSSSSTVENFLHLTAHAKIDLAKTPQIRLASIGPVTTETLRQKGLSPAAEANPHTIDALVAAILAAEK